MTGVGGRGEDGGYREGAPGRRGRGGSGSIGVLLTVPGPAEGPAAPGAGSSRPCRHPYRFVRRPLLAGKGGGGSTPIGAGRRSGTARGGHFRPLPGLPTPRT